MAEDPDLSAKVDKLTDTVNRLSQNFDDYVFHQKEVRGWMGLDHFVFCLKIVYKRIKEPVYLVTYMELCMYIVFFVCSSRLGVLILANVSFNVLID